MLRNQSSSSSASSSSGSSSASSSSGSSSSRSRIPVANGAPHFFVEWRKHADQHFVSQAQFAEMLKLIKEIHSQLVATEEVSRRQTMAFFTNKVRKIYFDHAVWENGERGRLEIEGLAELKNLHAGARISKEATMWIAGSLTAVLTTLRGALRKKLTQLILRDFEQRSPRLSIANYKAQLLGDKDRRKELVREGIHGIKEFFDDDDDRPATVTETHSTRSFKFWYNWIRDGCKPGAHSQDACMFRSIERKYSEKLKAGSALSTVMEDETNDVGNTTFGEGSTEMGHEPGFDFGEYSFELHGSSLSLDYDEAKVSSSNDGDDGGGDGDGDDDDGDDGGDKNGKLPVDESQHGRATQVDIRKMIDDIKKNEEQEAKKKEQEKKKIEREAKKKAKAKAKEEREAKKKEKAKAKEEREGKEKEEREAKKKEKEEQEAKKKEKEEREAKEKERKKRKAEDESPASKKANDNSQAEEENLNDDEGDSDSEQEGKKNPEDKIEKQVQGQTVKRIAKRSRTNTKSTDDDKKRAHENESENKLQPAKKRRAVTVTKPERTVTRSFAKKIALTTTPNSQTKKDTQLSGRMWVVSLEAVELANAFEAVIEDTPTQALKKLPVPAEFHRQPDLLEATIEQLAADGADWGGDDDPALYLLFSKEDRRKAGGTTVHLGFP